MPIISCGMRNRGIGPAVAGVVAALLAISPYWASGATYYVDSQVGEDNNDGRSVESPWRTVERANAAELQPGDRLLFRRGGLFVGNLTPSGSGSAKEPITVGAFGDGARPILDARGAVAAGQSHSATIRLFNQQHWIIQDLSVRNHNAGESPLLRKVAEHDDPRPVLATKYGLLIEGRDCGDLSGLTLRDLEVCDVNGNMGNKNSGGVHLTITRSSDPRKQKPSRFDGLVIERCHIHDVDRTGLSNQSAWSNRSLESQWGDSLPPRSEKEDRRPRVHDWYPSKNLVVRDNRIERTGANGVILRVADHPRFERNILYRCGTKGSGNAFFFFNCDDGVCEWNEASRTYFNDASDSWDGRVDHDAAGFDSDYQCKRSIFQYNYSHDNGYGGILVCRKTHPGTFNEGTVIRYNVFENNHHHTVRLSGGVTNTRFYNNVVVVDEGEPSSRLVWHKSWRGYARDSDYSNNVFFQRDGGGEFRLEASVGNRFSHNLYFGVVDDHVPHDPAPLAVDPGFQSVNDVQSGFPCLDAYRPAPGSPLIANGEVQDARPLTDLFRVSVPSQGAVSRGVAESP